MAEGQKCASPWGKRERLRQFVPSDLVGNRQLHFLSWAMRWEDQHKHAKAPNRLKKRRALAMNLRNKKKLKRISNNCKDPLHNFHSNMHSSPPHWLFGSDQFPWTTQGVTSSVLLLSFPTELKQERGMARSDQLAIRWQEDQSCRKLEMRSNHGKECWKHILKGYQ